jgi:hypothetical protein
MLSLWVAKALKDGVLLSGAILRQKWTDFARRVGIPEDKHVKLSEGWLTKFKQRHNLKEQRRHGEAASANQQLVEQERARIQMLIQDSGFRPKDIFNFDESGLLWAYVSFYEFPKRAMILIWLIFILEQALIAAYQRQSMLV